MKRKEDKQNHSRKDYIYILCIFVIILRLFLYINILCVINFVGGVN